MKESLVHVEKKKNQLLEQLDNNLDQNLKNISTQKNKEKKPEK